MSSLERIQKNCPLILLAEIGALIHDLGKLSEEFVSQKSSNPTHINSLFEHNLIFGTNISFPYEIDSDNNIELTENDVNLVKNDLLNEISKNDRILKDEDIKNIILNTFGTSFNKKISRNKAKTLFTFICEYYSSKTLDDATRKQLAQYLKENTLTLKEKETKLTDIIAMHHDRINCKKSENNKLVCLFKQVDGIDSGIDKGALNDNSKQPKDETYHATSFGYEIQKIDILSLKGIRDNLCKQLSDNLDAGNKIINIRNNIHGITKGPFLYGLGDTRRSGNDVTLWDHSYSVASLYKSALAKIIYEDKWTEPHKIKWRIIAVQYDKLGLIEKAHKLGDIVGYRVLTEKVDTAIKKIIEEDIAIGNEIYRDETGIYLTGPDLKKEELLGLIKERIIKNVQEITDGEVMPYITLGESSRSLVNLTEILKKSKSHFLCQEEIPDWTETWKYTSTKNVKDTRIGRSYCKNQCHNNNCVALEGRNEYQIDICPVCKVHPKCEHQNICKDCLERREERIKEWKDGEYQTIWIDEIADTNKKVAIVTGRFNLFNWLNGELLNTVFSQTLEDHKYTFYDVLIKLKKCLESNEPDSQLLKTIAEDAYKKEQHPRKFYDAVVVDRNPQWSDSRIDWENNPDYQKASEYLLLTLFRKHPSPARLRRIWETTQEFWEDIQKKLKNDYENYSNDGVEIRFKRLEIKLNNNIQLAKTLYNVKFEKFDILMYFDGEKLISIQNLTFSGLKKDLDEYKYEIIRIKRGDEKNSEFKESEIKDISFSHVQYSPFLEILLSPISFQFIVPATSVPRVMQLIQEKYSVEMGEVFGRLPLNMGIVIFDHKTPLYAAINASRKMLQDFEDKPAEKFIVKSNDGFIEFVNNDNGKSIKFEKPIEKSSRYYRNFIIENPTNIEEREGYFKSYIDSEERGLLNASKLKENDEVMLYTNHFDFEFLDTTTRRLEIRYSDDNYKRINQSEFRGPRPYYLEEFKTVFGKVWKLFDCLTISQIKKIQSQLAKLHLDWAGYENSDNFEIQIENILINIGKRKWWDPIKEDDQMLLKQVCHDKTIFDVLEFYNSILKLKPSCDKDE